MSAQRKEYLAVPTADQDQEQTIAAVKKGSNPPPAALRYVELLYVLAASLAWLVCSTSIILVNKYIMVNLGFKYPFAVSAMGMGCSSLLCFIYCDVLRMVPPVEGVDLKFYVLKICPVGAIQALTLGLGNLLYLYLTVAFIEIARATMPVFTMVGLFLAGLEVPTGGAIRAVALVTVGCALAAYGDVNVTFIGGILMLSNLAVETVRIVMTQFLLTGCNFHPLQTLKMVAPAAFVALSAGSLVREFSSISSTGAASAVFKNPGFFLAASLLGFGVNILAVVIIKVSSGTTLKVLAAVRGPVVVLFGVLLFAEHVTVLEFVGYSVALVGFVWYNFAKTAQPSTTNRAKDAGSLGDSKS